MEIKRNSVPLRAGLWGPAAEYARYGEYVAARESV